MSKRSRHQMAGSAVLQHLHACTHQEPTTLMVRAVELDEERAAEINTRLRTSARGRITISHRIGAGALAVAVACALIVGLVSPPAAAPGQSAFGGWRQKDRIGSAGGTSVVAAAALATRH